MIEQIIGWIMISVGITMLLVFLMVLIAAYSSLEAIKSDDTWDPFKKDDDA